MGLLMAYYGVLKGMLHGLTKLTDHPNRTQRCSGASWAVDMRALGGSKTTRPTVDDRKPA